ncbi:unnamed protein product, partial [Cylicostephanus goldi]
MLTQKIDVDRRMALMRAHTATHLLNWALRRVGAGRGQRGSSIEEDSFRFDYAIDDCAGEDDIVENVEALVQCMISEHKPVVSDMLPKEKAAELPMLQSEFREGKEYPAIVRVARIGNNTAEAVAVECCAGTHVLNTSSIVDFTILSDRSLAKGVRRIFALTGEKAKRAHRYGSDIVARLESLSENENPEDIAWIEGIDWAQMPDHDHGVARKLIKVIKKKRKAKIASDLKASLMSLKSDDGNVNVKEELQTDEAHTREDTSSAAACSANTENCLICKKESQESGEAVKKETADAEEPSFFDLVNSFSADCDAFAEAVDDLENI